MPDFVTRTQTTTTDRETTMHATIREVPPALKLMSYRETPRLAEPNSLSQSAILHR
jgi:hypothetical protein